MSNQTKRGIISIRLKKVTPIIQALFAYYKQSNKHENSDEWILAIPSEENTSSDEWQPVHKALEALCDEYGCKPEGKPRVDMLLISLGYHLSQPKEKKKSAQAISFQEVLNQVQKTSFEWNHYLEDLFRLALVFDDGHGIESIKAGLVEFSENSIFPEDYSGFGHIISKNVSYWQDSLQGLKQGYRIDEALSRNKLEEVANYLSSDLSFILAGIVNAAQRKQVHNLIFKALSADTE